MTQSDPTHGPAPGPASRWLLRAASIEVMPRTLAKIPDLRAILPAPRQVFVAHIEGTPIADMVDTARRLRQEGFDPVPHIPARLVPDAATLGDWLARYRGEADVRSVLALAGSPSAPLGGFSDSMQMMETGAFDTAGIGGIFVAGHPEGNRAIDMDGGEQAVMAAARWKQAFGARTDRPVTLVTQFVFDADPVFDWTERLAAEGIALPVRVGLAGPAKLQTLIRFGITCGVGASLGVLQRRARDVTKLLKPQDPGPLLDAFASRGAGQTGSMIRGVHFFPLGGIAATAETISRGIQASGRPAA